MRIVFVGVMTRLQPLLKQQAVLLRRTLKGGYVMQDTLCSSMITLHL